jgi:hypothetical protein
MNEQYIHIQTYPYIVLCLFKSLSDKPHDSHRINITVENNVMMALKQNSAPHKSNQIEFKLMASEIIRFVFNHSILPILRQYEEFPPLGKSLVEPYYLR